jgi:hypothetical protein
VKCAKPVRGGDIKLETTRKDYLSISGIEVYTAACKGNGCNGMTSSTRMRSTTSTSRTRQMPPMMKMGGMGGMGGMHMRRAVPFQLSFSMGSDKVSLNRGTASQGDVYSKSFPATNAFSNGSKFTHTKNKIGQWWKCAFNGGAQWVWKVRVLNRRDCCGARLAGVQISIGGQECGKI